LDAVEEEVIRAVTEAVVEGVVVLVSENE